MRDAFLPFALPDVDDDEVNQVRDCLMSGWLTTGPKVKAFEQQFAQAVGCKHAIAVNSATAAMHLAMEAIGLKQGDEVITSPYTFASTAEVVRYFGAKSFEDAAVLKFFETSTGNLLAAEAAACVGHHVALSVVGTERLSESGYFRAKIAQEKLIRKSSIPYTIVHATQFFEFLKRIADDATDGNTVRIAPVLIQPMAAEDVANAIGRNAVGPPVNGLVEVAGPQQFRLDELIRRVTSDRDDPRDVIADLHARYFGVELGERTLVPGDNARLAETRFDGWLSQSVVSKP